jgi:hypothetical protein
MAVGIGIECYVEVDSFLVDVGFEYYGGAVFAGFFDDFEGIVGELGEGC